MRPCVVSHPPRVPSHPPATPPTTPARSLRLLSVLDVHVCCVAAFGRLGVWASVRRCACASVRLCVRGAARVSRRSLCPFPPPLRCLLCACAFAPSPASLFVPLNGAGLCVHGAERLCRRACAVRDVRPGLARATVHGAERLFAPLNTPSLPLSCVPHSGHAPVSPFPCFVFPTSVTQGQQLVKTCPRNNLAAHEGRGSADLGEAASPQLWSSRHSRR